MTTIRWLFFLLLFWRKLVCSDSNVFIPLSAHGLTSLPRPYRLHSYVLNTHHFPCVAKRHGLATLLLLCGDISLNPGPISFGVVNCGSVRNKGPCINDTVTVHSVDILAVTETHIRQEERIAFYIPSPRQVSNSATNPVFMAVVVVLDFLSTKLYSLDLWIHLLSVPLKILALQLGLRLNRLC